MKNKNPDWLEISSTKIMDHMNSDHQNSIISSLHAQHGIKDPHAKMITLQVDGYYIDTSGRKLFIKFEKETESVEHYKNQLILQAKKYRNFELD